MVDNGKKAEKGIGNWKEFLHLIPRIHLPWVLIAAAFVFNLLYNEILLRLPTTTASLMAGELTGQALWDALWFYILYAVLACAQMLWLYLAQCMAVRNARNRVWNGMLNIRMDYYDTHNPSDLMSAITNDISAAVNTMVSLLVSVLPDIYYVIRALGTISSYDGRLMVSVFLLLPVKIIYMVYVGRWQYKTQAGVYREIGGLTAYLAERVRHLGLIKAYTNEDVELKNGEAVSKKLFYANMRVKKLSCATSAISTLVELLQNFVTMVFGVILLQKGAITMKQWAAFFLFAQTISGRFSGLIGYWTSMKSVQGAVARAAAILSAPQENNFGEPNHFEQQKNFGRQKKFVEQKNTAKQKNFVEQKNFAEQKNFTEQNWETPQRIEQGNTEIVFDQVSFSYGEKQALKQVSFTIPKGSATAIVGLCGSGKTTSLSLMERFYKADSGEVRIGGMPVLAGPLKEHRERFSYVQQGADIFSGTVREALTYGIRRSLTEEEILEAADLSGFADYLEKQPLGLDTPVAAGGMSMSGGQRQRLVLAREFLRDAPILLMDEPTSALDAISAKSVKEAIFSMFRGKTVVVVTHDMDLITDMDQIIVLNNGVVDGCGTYEQLLHSCPLFREMIEAHAGAES